MSTINYNEPNSKCLKLTSTEAQCIYWVIRGKSAKEIAFILHKSHRTIENHLMAIRAKFSCHKIIHAVSLAEKMGFIDRGEVFTYPKKLNPCQQSINH